MKNIRIISTDKPIGKFLNKNNNQLFLNEQFDESSPKIIAQNIYLTSNEEIKEGDWFIRDGSIHKCFRIHKTDIEFLTSNDSVYCGSNTFWSKEFCKKIILTTDQDLIKDGLQAIDDEFLEWFVKNSSCEIVGVEKLVFRDSGVGVGYEIIIPKEEPTDFLSRTTFDLLKQEAIEEEMEEYFKQELQFIDDEVECNNCGNIMSLTEDETIYACYNSECTNCYEEYEEEPKQETLEEAYKRIPKEIDYSEFDETSFNLGAKWQQKNSEEEVISLIQFLSMNEEFNGYSSVSKQTAKHFLEQFKKK